jgi:CheY-like chemotaxis protein
MARSSQTITELPGRRLAEHPPLNVLVAEDNEINRKVIETMLTLLGHRSRMANDGREALVLLDCAQFDVILMDLYMPEMDGAAAARAIRQRPDRCAQMPIVGLTASTLERDRNACLAAGMTAVITKPVEIATLTAALAPYTRRSSAPPILPAAPPDRSGAPCMSAVKAV